ncbi:MAG TPA: hypothetical protein VJS43_11555 [Candidatus Acidoferrales bacterium]|nr:hypothetical protein [Candidatus Acidoferrales bacterium]
MTQEDLVRPQVDQFVLEEIDSVPHLEALLLLWNNRPKQWSPEDMGRALYLTSEYTQPVLQELANRKLVSSEGGRYSYQSDPDRDIIIEALDRLYRREIIRISNMIHSKASPAVRAFARAFRLKKD